MPEKGPKPTHQVIAITPDNIPLAVRAMATDPTVSGLLRSLHGSGAQVKLHELKRTSPAVRRAVHSAANTDHITSKVFKPQAEDESPAIAGVREEAKGAIEFTAHNGIDEPLTHEQEAILTALNDHPIVRERRERHAITRFQQDRPHKVLKRFKIAGGLIGAAAVATEASELFLGHIGQAVGLVLAQSTDDAANAFIVPGSEKGGEKTKREILKDSKSLIPVLLFGGIADYTIIPHLLESPSMPVRIAGGVLFSLAAVGGSVGANILHLKRTNKEQKKADPQAPRMQRFKKVWEDHISDPFREKIWWGAGASMVAAVGTGIAKVLVGKDWSGVLELGVGMTESTPAFASLLFAKHTDNLKVKAEDWVKVKRAKEPIQIFPVEE